VVIDSQISKLPDNPHLKGYAIKNFAQFKLGDIVKGGMKMGKDIKEIKEFWENCFKRSNIDFKILARRDLSDIIERLNQYQVKRVLDLGCGFGHWSIVLSKAGFRVTAVDISSEAIRRVKTWANEERLSIDTKVCLAQEIHSLMDKDFDAVICNSVLDHMTFADASKVMQGIKDVLKPGGIAYLSFDGLEEGEEEGEKEFVVLEDGTRKYTKGNRKGMLWRFYTNEEIRILCKYMEIIEFVEKCNGKREVWVRRK